MAVYVRLNNGVEDSYDVHRGCPKCAYPESYITTTSSGREKCSNCDATAKLYHEPLVRKWWNPKVVAYDGSLTVTRGSDTVGHYPAGTWMSWRTA